MQMCFESPGNVGQIRESPNNYADGGTFATFVDSTHLMSCVWELD
jgi:hypothetical protein